MADQPQKSLVDMDARLRSVFEAGRPPIRDKSASSSSSRRAIRLLITEAERESAERMDIELQRMRAGVTAPRLNREFLDELRSHHVDRNPDSTLLSASSVRVRSFSSSAEPSIEDKPINIGPAEFYQYGLVEAEGSGTGWSTSILLQGFLLSPVVFFGLDGSGRGDASATSAAYSFDFTPTSDGEYEFRSLVMALGTYELQSADSPIYSKEALGYVVASLYGSGATPEDVIYADKGLFNRRVAKVADAGQLLGIEWVEASGFCHSGVKTSLSVEIKAVAYARGGGSRAKLDLSQANGGCFVCTGVWVTRIG